MRSYSFRKVTQADFPLITKWLNEPHIDEWWDDAETEVAQMAHLLGKGGVDMHIVEVSGRPFAFVQDYDVRAWPMPHYNDLPMGARGLESFIGDPAFLSQEHTAGYIEARVKALRNTCPMTAVDPEPTNTKAINTFVKAGFKPRRLASTDSGRLVQVMTHL